MLVLTRESERTEAARTMDGLMKALAIVTNAARRGRPLLATNPPDPVTDEPMIVSTALLGASDLVRRIAESKYVGDGMTAGVLHIEAERLDQIYTHGFTPEHDDQHNDGELVEAAVAYLLAEELRAEEGPPANWPLEDGDWNPSPDNRIRELAIAGALIAAEIDRLLRLRAKDQAATESGDAGDEQPLPATAPSETNQKETVANSADQTPVA